MNCGGTCARRRRNRFAPAATRIACTRTGSVVGCGFVSLLLLQAFLAQSEVKKAFPWPLFVPSKCVKGNESVSVCFYRLTIPSQPTRGFPFAVLPSAIFSPNTTCPNLTLFLSTLAPPNTILPTTSLIPPSQPTHQSPCRVLVKKS